MDPSKVVRCCLEHAASVAKTFLLSDAVVVEIKELNPIPRRMPRRRPKPPLPPMPQMPQMPPMPPMSMPTSGARSFGSKYGR
ncbi:putative groEL-like equatorial domain-containing protein [Rosa chinensis]|uniref:Putative groEL-like equatorial domain-containing protein n=2 Tax=Rosa chinensis TaxID=74649 RepID=A0A2P6R257_ROSCH|nr:putative groEL-like equatorial domain-containing protein [Rosa chinensis]